MPYRNEWVQPKLFLIHKGVMVYHTYKDDEVDLPYDYHFQAAPSDAAPVDVEQDAKDFDIRELTTWVPRGEETATLFKRILKAAIDKGELNQFFPS